MSDAPLPPLAALRDRLRSQIFAHYVEPSAEVLGVRLPRFTLWHWRTLDLFESPFAPDSPAETWSAADLADAVRICQLPVFGPLAPTRWDARRFSFTLWRYGARINLHARDLRRHIATAGRGAVCKVAKDGVPVKCPGWLFLTAFLIRAGWSERAAWAMAPGEARTWRDAFNVLDGGFDFLDEEDVQACLAGGETLENLGLA